MYIFSLFVTISNLFLYNTKRCFSKEEKNSNIVSMRAIGKDYNDKATYEALVNYGADEELTAFYLERSNQDLATMGEYDYCAVKIDADIENAKCAGAK